MTDRIVDPAQTPEALEQAKQVYLIEQVLKGALRLLYGDQAVHTTSRISSELSKELVKRGAVIGGAQFIALTPAYIDTRREA